MATKFTVEYTILDYLNGIGKYESDKKKIERFLKALYGPFLTEAGKEKNISEKGLLKGDEPVKGNEDVIRENAIVIIRAQQRSDYREYQIYNKYFDYLEDKGRHKGFSAKIERLPV